MTRPFLLGDEHLSEHWVILYWLFCFHAQPLTRLPAQATRLTTAWQSGPKPSELFLMGDQPERWRGSEGSPREDALKYAPLGSASQEKILKAVPKGKF